MIASAAPTPATSDWSLGSTFRATLVVVAVAVAFTLAYLFRGVIFLLFVGILIAIALKPLVRWLRQLGLSPTTASILSYGLLVIVAAGGIVAGTPLLAKQINEMLGSLPEFYTKAHDFLAGFSNPLIHRFVEEMPDELPRSLNLDREEAEGAIQAVAQGVSYGGVVLKAVLGGLASLLLGFYWSLHEDRAIRACLLALPVAKRDVAKEIIFESLAKLGAYLRGQGLLCLIMCVMVFVVYSLIGVPYAAALAVTAGLLEALPVFGPILAAVPALLVAVSTSPTMGAWVLVAIVAMQQFESNVLVPKIMDRSVGVNAVVTLLAIVAFSALGGFAGAVLAIPIAAIIQLVFDRLVFSRAASEPAPPAGRDVVSRLRYQAQALAHDVQLHTRNKEASPSTKSDRVEDGIEALAQDIDRYLAAAFEQTGTAAAATAGDEPA